MSVISYSDLALSWNIDTRADRRYNLITIVVLLLMLSAGLFMSSIELPPEERQAKREIPPRIANFLLEKKKAEPKVVKPKPKPKLKPKPKPKPKAKPKPKPEPKVKKQQDKKKVQKPLTKTEKKARDKAAESGLLALSNELADLMETDDISNMVGGAVKSATTRLSTSKKNQELLLADASEGSGGVSSGQYTTTLSKTLASKREISAVKQSLVSEESQAQKKQTESKSKTRKAGIRAEEGVTLVFDRNKSKLFSLYNRARRKNPNLEGKIILEITIAPSGKVTKVRIISSELDDTSLEAGIVKRIKTFNFGVQKVEAVTVTYPIDFLPS